MSWYVLESLVPMPKKEFRNPGKGMRPTLGYNPKKWNENFGEINWHNKWCAMCRLWANHTSSSCPQFKAMETQIQHNI